MASINQEQGTIKRNNHIMKELHEIKTMIAK